MTLNPTALPYDIAKSLLEGISLMMRARLQSTITLPHTARPMSGRPSHASSQIMTWPAQRGSPIGDISEGGVMPENQMTPPNCPTS